MKKVIAIASFVMIALSSTVIFTSCEPGQKSTTPTTMDTMNTQNKSMTTDTTAVMDTNRIKN